jgi:hypothetical protein
MVDGGEKLRMYLAEFNDGAKYLTRALAGKMPLVYYLAQKSDWPDNMKRVLDPLESTVGLSAYWFSFQSRRRRNQSPLFLHTHS